MPGYGLLSARDYEAVERLVAARPDLYATSAPQLLMPSEVRAGITALRTTLVGTTAAFQTIQSAPALYGRFLSADDEASAARVAVLGGAIAKDLFGDDEAALQAALGRTVELDGQPVEVIGILSDSGSIFGVEEQVFAPLSSVRLRLVGISTCRGAACGWTRSWSVCRASSRSIWPRPRSWRR